MLSVRKGTFAACLAGAVLCTGSVPSHADNHGLVRAVDDIPPAPVTGLTALLQEGAILVSWTASADDSAVATAFGGGYVYRNLVHGYRIYRSVDGGEPAMIGSTAPGVTEFTDQDITEGGVYVYDVRAFDSDNEAVLDIEPGSAEDIARTVTPVPLPRDADGNLVFGWFSYEGEEVDLDDFFLLSGSFGQREGDEGFDAVYDLDANGVIDIADFFVFSEYYSRSIANAAEVQQFITEAGTPQAINDAIVFRLKG